MNPESTELTLKLVVPSRAVDCEFTLAPTAHTAIIGHNGAGKSTILSALMGTLKRQKEDISTLIINGKDYSNIPTHQRLFAFVGQKPILFQHLNVLANVRYGLLALGVSTNEANKKARAMLEKVGLAGFELRRVNSLSGGEAQKVALARALVIDPKLVLLDEPFSALDVEAATQMRQLVKELCADKTLIFITHDLLDLLTLSSSVIALSQGKLIQHSSTAQFLDCPLEDFGATLSGRKWVKGKFLDDKHLQLGPVSLSSEAGFNYLNFAPANLAEVEVLLNPEYLQVDESGTSKIKVSLPQQLGTAIVRYLDSVPLLAGRVGEADHTFAAVKVSERMKPNLRQSR